MIDHSKAIKATLKYVRHLTEEAQADQPEHKQQKAHGFSNMCLAAEIDLDNQEEQIQRIAAEFLRGTEFNPDIKNPFLHFSLSFHPRERLRDPAALTALSDTQSRQLDLEEVQEIVEHFLRGIGLEGHQYTATQHFDTDHYHVHVVASRIRFPEGKVSDVSHINHLAQEVCREIEQTYNLVGLRSGHQQVNGWKVNAYGLDRDPESGPSLLDQLRVKLDTVIEKQQKTAQETSAQTPLLMSQFIQQLKAEHGVEATLTLCREDGDTAAGEVGIRYTDPALNLQVGGYQLGRNATIAGLQTHGIIFDVARDPLEMEQIIPGRSHRRPPKDQQAAVKQYLMDAIALTLQGQPSLASWIDRLQEWGVEVEPRYAKPVESGESAMPTQIRYRVGGEWIFSGSDLKQGTFKALQERGLQYDPAEAATIQAQVRPIDKADLTTSHQPHHQRLTRKQAKAAMVPLLEAALGLSADQAPTLADYMRLLQEGPDNVENRQGEGIGVDVHFRRSRFSGKKEPYGITYHYKGYRWSGSQVGKDYNLSGLFERGVQYDPSQRSAIDQLNLRDAVKLPPELEAKSRQLIEKRSGGHILVDDPSMIQVAGLAYKRRQHQRDELRSRIDEAIAAVYRPVATSLEELAAVIATAQTSLGSASRQEPLVPVLAQLQKTTSIACLAIQGSDATLLPYALEELSSLTEQLPHLPTNRLNQAQKREIASSITQVVAAVQQHAYQTTLVHFKDALRDRDVELILVTHGSGKNAAAKPLGIKYRLLSTPLESSETQPAVILEVAGTDLTVPGRPYTLQWLTDERGLYYPSNAEDILRLLGQVPELPLNAAAPGQETNQLTEEYEFVHENVSDKLSEESATPTVLPEGVINEPLGADDAILEQAWDLRLVAHHYGVSQGKLSEPLPVENSPYQLVYDGQTDWLTIEDVEDGPIMSGPVYTSDDQRRPRVKQGRLPSTDEQAFLEMCLREHRQMLLEEEALSSTGGKPQKRQRWTQMELE